MEKMFCDPAFRERRQAQGRSYRKTRYKTDAAYRQRQKAAASRRYAESSEGGANFDLFMRALHEKISQPGVQAPSADENRF